jgi:hypothetical protein
MTDKLLGRDYIMWNLRESIETLERIVRDMDADTDYGVAEFCAAMSHVYGHINTAWNARHTSEEAVEHCSEEDFRLWRQFPTDLAPLGTE